MTDQRWAEPLSRLLGAGTAKALATLGLRTAGDLMRHYPRRYADPGAMTDTAALPVGEHVTVMARVVSATTRTTRNGTGLLQAVVTDGQGELDLAFFAKHPKRLGYHENRLRPGRVGLFSGEVRVYRNRRQLTHPDYLLIGVDADDAESAVERASWPIPIYPATASVQSWQVHNAARIVLDTLTEADVPDPVPTAVGAELHLPGALEALRLVHEPHQESDWRRGQRALRFAEAFVLQVALARRRHAAAAEPAVSRPGAPGLLLDDFDAALPFTLTAGQLEVGGTIAAELAMTRPMQRLLQGEVGSGKTVVALRAMLQVVDSGGQAALLAPTEVLAAQHARTLRTLLGPLAEGGMLTGSEHATRIALLTGSQPAAVRRSALLDAASGAAGIVVGTHALLSEQVQFADLAMVVVDEQHRFGVEQRDALRAKAAHSPHLLVMTATPIPRTVAMTVFGDLETSVLREVPAGRPGVVTHLVPAGNERWTARTWARVREEVDAGHRAYVVCPRIDADTAGGFGREQTDDADLLADETAAPRSLRAVVEVAEELRALHVLAGVAVGMLHGRMSQDDKEAAMAAFASGEVPVLVSTTVVEVGLDVPEATVMVVLDADRFGISQLHQLRGRVGRGVAPGLCLLVAQAEEGSPAAERLTAMAATTDGFALAAMDLELRREGDVLGAAQSGRSSLRLLRVARDAETIELARTRATAVVDADPDLTGHPALAAAIADELDETREEFLDRA